MRLTIAQALDGRKVELWQWGILVIAVLTLVLDGLDIQLLAFVTPIILKEWQVDRVEFAPALAAALVGMAIGSAAGGILGDRLGRRPVLVISTLSFGIATALVSLMQGVVPLTLLRLFSGLGFGAATPNAFALVTEWLPQRVRARAIGLLAVAAPLGGMIGAGLSLIMLPAFGWRGCFAICGTVTIMLALLMIAFLPESTSYLMAKGKREKALALLRRVARVDGSAVMTENDPVAPIANSTASIFTRDLLRLNIGAAISFFACTFATYAILSWMPTVLSGSGFAMPDAIRSALIFNLMAVTGTLLSSTIIARRGSKQIMTLSCASALVAALVLPFILLSGEAQKGGLAWLLLFSAIGVVGLGLGGGMTSAYAIVSNGYPIDRRATGIGFGVMIGRAGGIVTVVSGSLLLRAGGDGPTLFLLVIAAMLVMALVGTFIVDRHVARPSPAAASV